MEICTYNNYIPVTDFYCNGYRWFNNYNETKTSFNPNNENNTWYGEDVLYFNNVTEINEAIQQLTLLRDSINTGMSKNSHIQKEFGHDGCCTSAGGRANSYPKERIFPGWITK